MLQGIFLVSEQEWMVRQQNDRKTIQNSMGRDGLFVRLSHRPTPDIPKLDRRKTTYEIMNDCYTGCQYAIREIDYDGIVEITRHTTCVQRTQKNTPQYNLFNLPVTLQQWSLLIVWLLLLLWLARHCNKINLICRVLHISHMYFIIMDKCAQATLP